MHANESGSKSRYRLKCFKLPKGPAALQTPMTEMRAQRDRPYSMQGMNYRNVISQTVDTTMNSARCF
jgi:hypothetical protein